MATKKPFTLRLRPDTLEWLDGLTLPNAGFIQAALDLIEEHDLVQYVQMKYAGMAVPRLGTGSTHAHSPVINFGPATAPAPSLNRDPAQVAARPAAGGVDAGAMFNPRTFTPQMNSKLRPRISPEKQAYLDSFKAQPLRIPGNTRLWFPRAMLAQDLELSPEAVDAWAQTLDLLEVQDVKVLDVKTGAIVDVVPCVSSMAIAFSLEALTPFCGEFLAWAQTHCEEA